MGCRNSSLACENTSKQPRKVANVIRIQNSVGREGLNTYKDVVTVQTLINDCIRLLAPLKKLDADGKCGPRTVAAIEHFQRTVVRLNNPDGRVDPSGATLRALVSNSVAPKPAPASSALVSHPTGVAQQGTVRFPLASRPVESYKQGMRRFGSNRKGGRLHAGCDLYAKVGTPILALDNGEVIAHYPFYLGTYALEVRHPSFIARYGEITRNVPADVKVGAKIVRGQTIGYVGQLTGLNMSMLHLELYSGKATGPLTVRAGAYKRRGDLIDPTAILDGAALQ
jgi:murein DD-endopeptidase MepM/ murein hydrolase activator NlpD